MRSLYEIYPDMEDEIDELELETCITSSLRAVDELYSTEPPRRGGALTAYLREEQRMRNIACALKRSYPNNRHHIEEAYKYFYGTMKGFKEFWEELETDESHFRSVSGNILCDPDYLLERFRELPGMARRLDQNGIKSWDQLIFTYDLE